MRRYYVEVSFKYLDYDFEEDDVIQEPFEGNYSDSFFIVAKSNERALKKAFNKAQKEFKEEESKNGVITSFCIDDIYETSDDARI
jgi:hypothetical protein